MVFTFGDCELDEERWELQRAGAAVAVQPKELALLFYLVRHRDRVVNREELLEALWPGVFVGDGTLTRAVSLARLAIGGRDRDGDGIQTIARRGYRFSAAVRVIETPVPPATQPEPPALQSPVDSSNPFVGREHTVARLREAWAQAAASSTRVVLLSGPAGIGKTRTAHELARFVRQHGGHVVTTRGLPGAADAPYALWVQAAAERQHAHATTDPVSNPPFPEPSSRDWSNPGLAAPTEPDVAPEVTTRRTLDAIAQWVRVAAAGAPLLLVLDDLHRADAPSLEALTFVASAVADARLLMLAAFRDDEIEAAPTLQSVCATLTATGRCESVQLQGLNQADTGRLAGVLAGSALSAGMAATLWGRTEGNPLFVHEIVRLLVDEGSALQPAASTLPAQVPVLVRDVIGSRVARLSDACRDCLAAAATIGVHFAVELLQRTTGIPTDQLLELIEEAERHRVLEPDSTIEPGYRFAHPLMHEVVLQNIGRGERVRLHWRVAAALEDLYAGDLDRAAPQLAEHYVAVARTGAGVEPALRYLKRSAERAVRAGTYQEAAKTYERALETAALTSVRDLRSEGELLISLAEARGWAHEIEAGMAAAEKAAAVARQANAPDLLARAALSVAVLGPAFGPAYDQAVALLNEAERLTRTTPSVLRVRVAARLAHLLHFTPNSIDRRVALCAEADTLLRSLGIEPPLSVMVDTLYATWSRLSPPERLARAEHAVDIAERSQSLGYLFYFAAPARFTALLELGDLAAVEANVRHGEQLLAEHPAGPLFNWFGLGNDVMWALLRGRFAEAERHIFACWERGQHARGIDFTQFFAIALGHLRYEQGRVNEIESAMRNAAAPRASYNSSWRAGMLTMLCELDAVDEARAELARWPTDQLPDPANDRSDLVALAHLAGVCRALADRERAALLYARLLPHAGLNVVPFGGTIVFSSVEQALGQFALAADRLNDAEHHFENALAANQRLDAPPFTARTQLDYARLLLKRRRRGDAARARDLLSACARTAEELGMARVAQQASTLLSETLKPTKGPGRR